MGLFILHNSRTGMHARFDSVGEHDGKVTDDMADAKEFDTFGQASDYSQNFGADWSVEDPFAAADKHLRRDNGYCAKWCADNLPPR